MPDDRPKKRIRTDTRMRVAFNEQERALIFNAAGPDGMRQAAFVRATVIKALSLRCPEALDAPPVTAPRSANLKTTFSPEEKQRITAFAAAHGMTRAEFMRHVVLAATGQQPRPPRKRQRERDQLLHTLSLLAMQIKKLGTNINQLAHQANAGMVPVSRAEADHMLKAHAILMTHAKAAVDEVLP